MTVSIDIDLDALDAKMEIANLKVMLESLGDDLDLDLNLDGDLGDTLDNLTETMDELGESFNSDLNETIDRLEALDVDLGDGGSRGEGFSSGDTGGDSGDGNDSGRRNSIKKLFSAWDRSPEEIFGRMSIGRDDSGPVSDGMTHRGIVQNAARRGGVGSYSDMMDSVRESGHFGDNPFSGLGTGSRRHMRGVSPGFSFGDSLAGMMPSIGGRDGRGGFFRTLTKGFRGVSNAVEGTTSAFKSLIPNMQMWWRLIAVAIPALGAMAVQALGVASAMGAIGVAGASMIGLGLIGHGDSMAESFRNAGQEIDELKKGLFDTFQPTAGLFSGIQSEFFDFIPQAMEPVARSMEGFTVFEDDLFAGFGGAMDLLADLFDVMVENEAIVSDLAMTFGSIIATNLVSFFEWLLVTTSENKQMLIELGAIFRTVAIAMYEVFMMISRSIIMFEEFFGILKWVAGLLNNKFVSGIVGVVGILYILVSVASTVYGALMAIGTVLMSGLIPGLSVAFTMLQGYIFNALLATTASYALAQSIATVVAAATLLTGIGIAAWAGTQMYQGMKQVNSIRNQMGEGTGMSGAGGSSGGNTTVINEGDTVNVDIGRADNASMEKFQDMRSGGGSRGPTGGSYTGN